MSTPEAQSRRLTNQLTTLKTINEVLRTTRELLPIYRLVGTLLEDAVRYDSLLIGVYNGRTDRIRYEYAVDEGMVEEEASERPLSEAVLSARLIRGRVPLLINDLQADAAASTLRTFGQTDRTSRAWMGTPLICSDQVCGMLAIMRYDTEPFTTDDLEFVELIASQLALAVENIQLEQELREKIRQLSTPIIPVAEGTLVLPLVGQIDGARAQLITERTLDMVVARQAERVLIDVTGVSEIDAQVLDSLLRVIRAIELLGAHCAIVGMNAEMAYTLAMLNVDLQHLDIYRDLQRALDRR